VQMVCLVSKLIQQVPPGGQFCWSKSHFPERLGTLTGLGQVSGPVIVAVVVVVVEVVVSVEVVVPAPLVVCGAVVWGERPPPPPAPLGHPACVQSKPSPKSAIQGDRAAIDLSLTFPSLTTPTRRRPCRRSPCRCPSSSRPSCCSPFRG